MSFFEPLDVPQPEEPEPVGPERWVPPEWLGPSENVVGAEVGVRSAVFRDDRLAIWLDRVLAYPTGLMVSLALYLPGEDFNGQQVHGYFPWALTDPDPDHGRPSQPTDPDSYFRFGARYSDGRVAVTGTWDDMRGDRQLRLEDPPGVDELVIVPHHGMGGSQRHTMGVWLWPLPPAGDVDIVVQWPAAGVPESVFAVPGDQISRAVGLAVRLWPDAE